MPIPPRCRETVDEARERVYSAASAAFMARNFLPHSTSKRSQSEPMPVLERAHGIGLSRFLMKGYLGCARAQKGHAMGRAATTAAAAAEAEAEGEGGRGEKRAISRKPGLGEGTRSSRGREGARGENANGEVAYVLVVVVAVRKVLDAHEGGVETAERHEDIADLLPLVRLRCGTRKQGAREVQGDCCKGGAQPIGNVGERKVPQAPRSFRFASPRDATRMVLLQRRQRFCAISFSEGEPPER